MNLNYTLWVNQFEQHMSGDRFARLIFYRESDECAICVNLDANSSFVHARLREARANEKKTGCY